MGQECLRLLLVEDVEDDALILVEELRAGDYEVLYRRVETEEGLKAALDTENWDLIIADFRLPRFSATAALDVVKRCRLDIPFLVVSGAIEEETAVAILKAGAHDFVRKDNLARLLPAIERELRECQDRYERRKASEALRASEERFRSITQSVTDGIVCTDALGTIVLWNQAAVRLFGYAEEEVLGTPLTRLFVWNDLIEIVRKTPSAVIGQLLELNGIHKDQSQFPLELSLSSWSVGPDVFYTAILRDIAPRKQTEATITRLASIVESSEDAIVSKDLAGTILSWNRGAERIFGYKAEEMIGQSIQLLIPKGRHNELVEILDRIKRGESVEHFESIQLCKDGKEKIVSLSVAPLKDPEGKIIGASKIARDITPRKQAEEALRRAHDELERRVEKRTGELANANEVLQEKLKELEAFHDVVVGRELKMMELEREIEVLRAKILPIR